MTTTSTITAGIAALQVLKYGSLTEYITIDDISATELHIESRDCPILFPVPGEWKGGAEGSPDTETTFGTASGRMWWKHQKFVYALAEDVVGAGRDINDQYLSASENADAIWTARACFSQAGTRRYPHAWTGTP